MAPVAGAGGGAAPVAPEMPSRPRSITRSAPATGLPTTATGAAAPGGDGPTWAWKAGTPWAAPPLTKVGQSPQPSVTTSSTVLAWPGVTWYRANRVLVVPFGRLMVKG